MDERADEPRGRPLPSFSAPPVIEVLIGVAFDPSQAALKSVNIYDFYRERYHERFPDIEERAPYIVPTERFGAHARMPDIKFELLDRPIPPMHLFIGEDGAERVQIQRDWFARNWRKRDSESSYPRYPSLSEPFESDLQALADFTERAKIGLLSPKQCEITYINHIQRDDVWTSHGDVAHVMRHWQDVAVDQFSPDAERVQFSISYLMPDSISPTGRLHVALQPDYDSETGDPIFVLTLTARGITQGPRLEDAMAFLNMGHEWIVRCFADITTESMQSVWRRNDR